MDPFTLSLVLSGTSTYLGVQLVNTLFRAVEGKSNRESQRANLETQLASQRENQNMQLEAQRENQRMQLEAQRENQRMQIAAQRANQKRQLEAQRESLKMQLDSQRETLMLQLADNETARTMHREDLVLQLDAQRETLMTQLREQRERDSAAFLNKFTSANSQNAWPVIIPASVFNDMFAPDNEGAVPFNILVDNRIKNPLSYLFSSIWKDLEDRLRNCFGNRCPLQFNIDAFTDVARSSGASINLLHGYTKHIPTLVLVPEYTEQEMELEMTLWGIGDSLQKCSISIPIQELIIENARRLTKEYEEDVALGLPKDETFESFVEMFKNEAVYLSRGATRERCIIRGVYQAILEIKSLKELTRPQKEIYDMVAEQLAHLILSYVGSIVDLYFVESLGRTSRLPYVLADSMMNKQDIENILFNYSLKLLSEMNSENSLVTKEQFDEFKQNIHRAGFCDLRAEDANGHYSKSVQLLSEQNFDEALTEINLALALDPFNNEYLKQKQTIEDSRPKPILTEEEASPQSEKAENDSQPESVNEKNSSQSSADDSQLNAGDRKVFTVNGVEFAFRWCPAGTFMMGSPVSESGRYKCENQHEVKLSKGFWIMETQVTQKQWKAVMGTNPSEFKGDDLPVESISWNDCQEFCKKCAQLGLPVQLPTEAQWEYACRAGTTGEYAGNLDEMAWYKNYSNDRKTYPVGTKKPNAWGLHDMHGNVWEWCADGFEYYPRDSVTDPEPPEYNHDDTSDRICRGGSWYSDYLSCRSAKRNSFSPYYSRNDQGFRCVLCQDSHPEPMNEKNSSQSNADDSQLKAGDRKVYTVNGVEFAFRWCPAGTFMMGSPKSEEGRSNSENQHKVTLTKGFWMMETQVTLGMFKAFVGDTGYDPKGDRLYGSWRNPRTLNQDDKHPVTCVSWNDAVEFCKWLSKKTGQNISLPTEAQWEYACRAGTTGAYAGNLDEMAWYNDFNDKTHPVGTKKPNAWGLYDMHGNVLEWCADWFEDGYPRVSVTDPAGPSSGANCRVIRGGGWVFEAWACRSAARGDGNPKDRYDFLGFRCVICQNSQPESVNEKNSSQSSADDSQLSAGDRKVYTVNGVEFAFRWCPAGTFMMGSPESEEGHDDLNETQHRVTLTKGFWMMETQVTQKQWKAVMGNNPSGFKGDDFPVVQVSWNNCEEFCEKCTQLGLPVQLPTEAQWEYACRAGTTGAYAGRLKKMAWYICHESHPVGTKMPNAWGLYDMHGNVEEWCLDWYGFYPRGSVTDPAGPSSGNYSVARGGCYLVDASECRSAARDIKEPDEQNDYVGFRCVLCQDSHPEPMNEKNSSQSSADDSQLSAGDRKVYTVNGVEFAFRWCPAGTFLMGSPESETGHEEYIETQHQVTLTKGFWMMETQVTQEQWEAVMGNNPSYYKGDDLPVEQVSWNDCQKFCEKCTQLGLPVQLPTEAQWEYACRAGTTGAHAGRLKKIAWYDCSETHPVGTKKSNAWGLYDMHGNVWEWCQDWFDDYPRGSVTDPIGPSSGSDRVGRGGGWSSSASCCRSANRYNLDPGHRDRNLGFRVVRGQ